MNRKVRLRDALGTQAIPLMSPRVDTYDVAGVRVSSVNRAQATETFFTLTTEKTGGFITVRDAHGIVEAQEDSRLHDIVNCSRMTLPDGAPVVWVGRLKHVAVERVTGSDFVNDVFSDPRARRIRHYFYGSSAESISRAAARAAEILGADAVAGWHSPPIREADVLEDDAVLEHIAATRPDVIWVGLSTPKQEYWMANHAGAFPGTVLVGIGATVDFFAGVKTRAPGYLQRMGLEWLFRIWQEPKRLWPRYRRVVPGMLKVLISAVFER